MPTPPSTYNALDSNVPVFAEVLITTALSTMCTPPATFTEPAPALVAGVVLSNVDKPWTDKVDDNTAGPCNVELLVTFNKPPTYKFLATPAPPATTKDPVVVDVALMLSVI